MMPRGATGNGEGKSDQMSDVTAGVLESPGRPRGHSAPCVISPVPPGIPESAVLFRLGEQDRPEVVIPLERPLSIETLQRLASRKGVMVESGVWHLHQAATRSTSVTSTPSLNFTPVITLVK